MGLSPLHHSKGPGGLPMNDITTTSIGFSENQRNVDVCRVNMHKSNPFGFVHPAVSLQNVLSLLLGGFPCMLHYLVKLLEVVLWFFLYDL